MDDDEAVDAVVDEPLGELELTRGLAVGIGDERAAVGGVGSSRWTARTSSWFQKSARLPTRSPTTPVSPPASARAIGSASYPSSSAAARTRSSVSVDTCIPRSA